MMSAPSSIKGGAIASYSPLEVWNCSFVRNTSTQGGGAIMFNGFSLGAPLCQVFNSLFVGNSIDAPSAQGGAIDDFYANLDIENCTFTLNTCQADSADAAGGGALALPGYYNQHTFHIENSIFWRNSAASSPGSVATLEGQQILTNVTVQNLTVNNTLIEDLNVYAQSGVSNIDTDPIFKNPISKGKQSLIDSIA